MAFKSKNDSSQRSGGSGELNPNFKVDIDLNTETLDMRGLSGIKI